MTTTRTDSPAPAPAVHKIRWFVYAGGERIPRTATMRGQWGYDATCSCGWDTKTGGATLGYVKGEVWWHKRDAANDAAEALA